MNKDEIIEIIQAFNSSSASFISIEQHDMTITLDKSLDRGNRYAQPAPVQYVQHAPIQNDIASAPVAPQATATAVAPANNDTATGTPVKAQLVGVFYDRPNPDSAPFVKVGQAVNAGDTLCIIEAMKVMNEIKAPQDGTIASINVNNAELVEFGQTLITIA